MKQLSLIVLILTFLSVCSLLHSETIAEQGFEAGDTWEYSANNVGTGYWGIMDAEFGGANAHSGEHFWTSWLLGSNEGMITFANQDLPLGYVYSINFHYYTKLLSAPGEYCRYALSYDSGSTWTPWTELLPNTQAWTLVSIEIPVYEHRVMLRVAARHSGTSKYVHWDSFVLNREVAPPAAPVVYNLQIAQRTDGSGLVDICYDLFDQNNDPGNISLLVSTDAGASYAFVPDPANLSGDIGSGIATGTDKHIVWNAGAETVGFESNDYRFRILTEDGTTYGMVATPVYDPPAGTYTTAQTVSITCATAGAEIRYTTDGSEPDENSAVYSSPLTISTTIMLKAKAFKANWQPSEISTSAYTIVSVPTGFVYVPGGTFTMGDTHGGGSSDELPTHSVALSSFYMGKYEVTQAEWTATMGSIPGSGYGVGASYPSYGLKWYESIVYCNLRSISEGLTPVYTISNSNNPEMWGITPWWDDNIWNAVVCDWNANGYRLPTEAEWEYTARSAVTNPDFLYSGSDIISTVAWYNGNDTTYGTKPVGTKADNELGIHDMSGNVVEFCWDWYSSNYYSNSPQINPRGPINGVYRVSRGGFWNSGAIDCRVTKRNPYEIYHSGGDVGLRLCRSTVLQQLSTPCFNPPGGNYSGSQSVSISSASHGAIIRYTTDGSEPNEESTLFTGLITVSLNTTIKAKAFQPGLPPSITAIAWYGSIPDNFQFVEGGTFNNGTSDVTVSSFYMDKYELTQSGYQAIMGSNPASGYGVGSNYPVYNVSWFNAIEYCNRRSLQEGLTPCYSYSTNGTNPSSWPSGWNTSDANHTNVSCNWTANGYRLPTEMEWMFAARGGNLTHNYTYSGSNNIGDVAWYTSNSGSTTHAVGTRAANELGIFDMSGNVFEWNWDIYGTYPSGAQTNPHGAQSGSARVRRGGSWTDNAYSCTVSLRDYSDATVSYGVIGFRCVRVSP